MSFNLCSSSSLLFSFSSGRNPTVFFSAVDGSGDRDVTLNLFILTKIRILKPQLNWGPTADEYGLNGKAAPVKCNMVHICITAAHFVRNIKEPNYELFTKG